MPKGVEHQQTFSGNNRVIAVFYPLMPKGVEHANKLIQIPWVTSVFYPLMPKGVEHVEPDAVLRSIWTCFIR